VPVDVGVNVAKNDDRKDGVGRLCRFRESGRVEMVFEWDIWGLRECECCDGWEGTSRDVDGRCCVVANVGGGVVEEVWDGEREGAVGTDICWERDLNMNAGRSSLVMGGCPP